MLQGIPFNKNPLNSLIDLALMHSKAVLGAHKKVAILGPANVGKSTLFNQFVRAKLDQAEVSPIPGTTRVNKEADAGIFTMIDTPGADAVGQDAVLRAVGRRQPGALVPRAKPEEDLRR